MRGKGATQPQGGSGGDERGGPALAAAALPRESHVALASRALCLPRLLGNCRSLPSVSRVASRRLDGSTGSPRVGRPRRLLLPPETPRSIELREARCRWTPGVAIVDAVDSGSRQRGAAVSGGPQAAGILRSVPARGSSAQKQRAPASSLVPDAESGGERGCSSQLEELVVLGRSPGKGGAGPASDVDEGARANSSATSWLRAPCDRTRNPQAEPAGQRPPNAANDIAPVAGPASPWLRKSSLDVAVRARYVGVARRRRRRFSSNMHEI